MLFSHESKEHKEPKSILCVNRKDKVKDSVAIAFEQSNYPTPYGDNSISGNKPGHREWHLGRSYAPDPINYSQLSHALIASYSANLINTESIVVYNDNNNCNKSYLTYWNTSMESENEAHSIHACRNNLINADRYILNVKNGGRRHFDELRGVESKWIPSLRISNETEMTTTTTTTTTVGGKKGKDCKCTKSGVTSKSGRNRGVYNYDLLTTTNQSTNKVGCTDAIRQSLLERERKADPLERGKAHVYGPPDHTIFELGMCELMRVKKPELNVITGQITEKTLLEGKESSLEDKVQRVSATNKVETNAKTLEQLYKSAADANVGLAFASACTDELYGLTKDAYECTRRPDDDEVAYLRAVQMFNTEMQHEARERRRKQSIAEDIEAVRQLPLLNN